MVVRSVALLFVLCLGVDFPSTVWAMKARPKASLTDSCAKQIILVKTPLRELKDVLQIQAQSAPPPVRRFYEEIIENMQAQELDPSLLLSPAEARLFINIRIDVLRRYGDRYKEEINRMEMMLERQDYAESGDIEMLEARQYATGMMALLQLGLDLNSSDGPSYAPIKRVLEEFARARNTLDRTQKEKDRFAAQRSAKHPSVSEEAFRLVLENSPDELRALLRKQFDAKEIKDAMGNNLMQAAKAMGRNEIILMLNTEFGMPFAN